MKYYYIYANISGAAKWHLVYDKKPGLLFVEEDFEEEEYDIEEYKKEFPDNEILEIPNPSQIKHPLGICTDHMKAWDRMDCPLCDFLFVYDRLDLAIKVIGDALELLSKINEGADSDELDEACRGRACILLEKYYVYAKHGNDGPCTCDAEGESRCKRHGLELLAENLQAAKS